MAEKWVSEGGAAGSETPARVALADFEAARERIRGDIRTTQLIRSPALSAEPNRPVLLKLEHQQVTGSFKVRGALNAVLQLSEAQKEAGIVAASTGNHGRGLAYAAKKTGVHCVICMSSLVPQVKIDGIKALGAEVRIIGRSQDEAQIEVDRLVAEQGMTMLPPFDHRDIIVGQGSLGLELIEQRPDIANVIVPLSGGGLISGVASAVKLTSPEVKIIGVTMKDGAAMYESLRAGHPVEVEETPTLADSLGGGIGLDNEFTFDIVRRFVDEVVLLSEAEIAEGMRHAYWHEKQVVEGAAAVGIGALLAEKVELRDGPCALILSGGNVDMTQHHRIISGANGLEHEGAG